MSGLRFALAISLTAWLAVQAVRLRREETRPPEDARAAL
jgi:hypothetical protein